MNILKQVKLSFNETFKPRCNIYKKHLKQACLNIFIINLKYKERGHSNEPKITHLQYQI